MLKRNAFGLIIWKQKKNIENYYKRGLSNITFIVILGRLIYLGQEECKYFSTSRTFELKKESGV